MLPVFWRESARADLRSIIGSIAQDKLSAARRMRRLIEACVSQAAEHPYLYRTGRLVQTRVITAHPNYVLVYQVKSDRIEVVSVLHSRQEYP